MNSTQFNLIVTATDGIRAKMAELKAEIAAAFIEMTIYKILLELATSFDRKSGLSENFLPEGNITIRKVFDQNYQHCRDLTVSLRGLNQEELTATAAEVTKRIAQNWTVVSCTLEFNSANCIELNLQLRP